MSESEKWVNELLDTFNSSSRSPEDKKSMETSFKTVKTLEVLYKHLPPEHFPSYIEALKELSKMHHELKVEPEAIKQKLLEIIKEYYLKIPLEGLQGGDEVLAYR